MQRRVRRRSRRGKISDEGIWNLILYVLIKESVGMELACSSIISSVRVVLMRTVLQKARSLFISFGEFSPHCLITKSK